MRKLSTFFLGSFCTCSLMAAGTGNSLPISKTLQQSLPSIDESMMRRHDTKATFINSEFKAPIKVDASDQIIYKAPDGEVVTYSTTGNAYIAIMGYIGELPVEDFVTEMVYCEDGSVYWQNSITMIVANTYIKGTDEGDRLVFELPQAILLNPQEVDEEGNATLAYAQRMSYDEENQFYYVDEENQTVIFTKNDDGSLTADLDGNDIIGMTTPDGRWYGYGNYNIVLTPSASEEVVTPPENLITEEWMLISNFVGRKIELGFDGNDLYLHKPVLSMTDDPGLLPEDYWVKGSIENGKITLPKQYIGKSDLMMMSIYFTPSDLIDYEDLEVYDTATLEYDAEAKIMVSDTGFSLVAGPGFVFGYTEAPTIRWQPEEVAINLPNPVIVDAFNYDETIHYGVFAFNLPPMNKDGYCLNPEYIFTRLYVNGEPYIFDPEDYDLENPMEWVPFLFDDGWDFHQDGEYHQFDLYFDGADSMGVEAKYDDGTTVYYTDIVSISLDPSAVTTIDSDNVNILSTEGTMVFNLNGLKCNPATLTSGIYIVTTPKSTKKIIVK